MRKLFVTALRGLVWSVFAFVGSFFCLVAGYAVGMEQTNTAGVLDIFSTVNFFAQWGVVGCLVVSVVAYMAVKAQKAAVAVNKTVCEICTPST